MSRLLLYLCITLAGFCSEPDDDNWPQFRGPQGTGIGSDKISLPAQFGPTQALLWKTDLPKGHGSPCVWGDRIFVTGFDAAASKLEVIAVERKNGQIAWRATIPTTEIEQVHATSSPATSTPVTDGKRIYVYSGSFGMLAYEWDGRLAWQHLMGVSKSPYGSGSSPVLAGDLLIIARDYPPSPVLFAIHKKDGTPAWKVDLAPATQGGARTSHATALIWNGLIVLNRAGEVSAYAVADGKRLWALPTASQGTSTPAGGDGVLYVNAPTMGSDTYNVIPLPPVSNALEKYDKNKDGKLSPGELPAEDLFFMKRGGVPDNVPGAHFSVKSFFRFLDANKDGFIDEGEYSMVSKMMSLPPGTTAAAGILAIRPSAEDAAPAVLWSEARGAAEVTTPLEYHGRVYSMNSGGVITCIDARTGKLIYRGRINAPGAYYSSPVAAGGKVFAASAEGVVTVLGGGETLAVLANNDLGEPIYGTPAPVGSALYIRSLTHLWAFGN